MEIHLFHALVIAWMSVSQEKFKKTFECSLFSHIFFPLWEFDIPMLWELYGLKVH